MGPRLSAIPGDSIVASFVPECVNFRNPGWLCSLDMKPRPLAVDPKSFERSGVLPPRFVPALASGTRAEEKPLPSIAEEPGPVNLFAPNGGYLTESAPSGGPSSYHGLWPWLVIVP